MTQPLSTILAPLDRVSVEQERDRLREELADYEALLRLIDRHGAGSDMPLASPPPAPAVPVQANGASHTDGNGNGNAQARVPLSTKRKAVLAILNERPGRWTTAEMRKALEAEGIDSLAGTPVKNILWQLAKVGKVSATGSGVYEFPALDVSASDPRVQEAMGGL